MKNRDKPMIAKRISFWSFSMVTIITILVLTQNGLFFKEAFAAQKFYPNGRYGRRSVIPPLMSSENTDEGITFIGIVSSNSVSKLNALNSNQPTTLVCYNTGYSNLLKCSL